MEQTLVAAKNRSAIPLVHAVQQSDESSVAADTRRTLDSRPALHGLHSREACSDACLVGRAGNNDPEAFDVLFRRHYPQILNFALRLEGNRDNAEDVAQTAFERAYEGIHHIRDGQAFQAWMYRTVVNLVRDRAKQRSRKPLVSFLALFRRGESNDGSLGEVEEVEFSDNSPNPERIAVAEEFGRLLRTAVAALPLEFRVPLVLHHMDGLDVREIAAVLGIPEGTVKSRIGRARQRLRISLKGWLDP